MIALPYLLCSSLLATSMTPYIPTPGWNYAIEAAGRATWPSCNARFLSYTDDCSTITLSSDYVSSPVHLISASGDNNTFNIRLGCGNYLSYQGDCDQDQVDAVSTGTNQAFRFVASSNDTDGSVFGWSLEGVGRAKCPNRFVSFASDCSSTKVTMGEAAPIFRLQVVSAQRKAMAIKSPNSGGR